MSGGGLWTYVTTEHEPNVFIPRLAGIVFEPDRFKRILAAVKISAFLLFFKELHSDLSDDIIVDENFKLECHRS